MKLERAINLVRYGGERPAEVSEGRWNAIVRYVNRYLEDPSMTLVIERKPEAAERAAPVHSRGADVHYVPYNGPKAVKARVGSVVVLDSGTCERLLPGDPEPIGTGWPGCDFRWPNPVAEWREKHSIACNVHVSGRKARWGADIGRNSCWWVRVKIEWVGDCEPSTYGSGYMLIED